MATFPTLPSQVEITTPELMVNAGITNFTGVVQAQTVIAASIIPGSSGNLW